MKNPPGETKIVLAYSSRHFVALDPYNGDRPFKTDAKRAHDFKTVEAAIEFATGTMLKIVKLRVVYRAVEVSP
jgi:hypothetical protein